MKVTYKGQTIWSGEQLRLAMLWHQWPEQILIKVDGKVTLINKRELTVQ
jgi:hypothetical protein